MKETTKRSFFIGACVALAMTIMNVVLLYIFPKVEKKNIYGITAIVTNVSQTTDTVTIKDFNGNLWQFKGIEDWEVDDIASCVMDNKGTAEIKDDVIVSVRYSGYWEGWAE